MTILGALLGARSLESPTQPLTSTALADWLGGAPTSSGESVSEKRVLGIPAYYRAIAIVSGTMAGLPLKTYEIGTRTPVKQHLVLDDPNPRQTPFEFWQTNYMNALSWGNMFGRKLRDRSGIVREVWPIHPRRCEVEDTFPTSSNPEGKWFYVEHMDGSVGRYTSWDIFHVPYMSPDGVQGVRPLQLFRESLGTGLAAEKTAGRLFRNNGRPAGILKTKQKLDQPTADTLKARWKANVGGPDNAGNIAVLGNDTEFQAVMLPPQDAQLLESRKWTVTEISRMVGLPPFMLGDVEKSTSWGTGIEQQVLGLVKFGLKHWSDLVEQRASRELLPGGRTGRKWFSEYSLEGLLRGDSKARAEFYRVMVNIGAMTLNEVRVLENNEPVDGLDVFLISKNVTAFDPSSGTIAQAIAAQSKKP